MATPVPHQGGQVQRAQDATQDNKLFYQTTGKSGMLVKVTLIKLPGAESPVSLDVKTQSRFQQFVNFFS